MIVNSISKSDLISLISISGKRNFCSYSDGFKFIVVFNISEEYKK